MEKPRRWILPPDRDRRHDRHRHGLGNQNLGEWQAGHVVGSEVGDMVSSSYQRTKMERMITVKLSRWHDEVFKKKKKAASGDASTNAPAGGQN